jgi:hypothetical protein
MPQISRGCGSIMGHSRVALWTTICSAGCCVMAPNLSRRGQATSGSPPPRERAGRSWGPRRDLPPPERAGHAGHQVGPREKIPAQEPASGLQPLVPHPDLRKRDHRARAHGVGERPAAEAAAQREEVHPVGDPEPLNLGRCIGQVDLVVGEVEQPAAVSLPQADPAGVVPGVEEGTGGPVSREVQVGAAVLGDGQRRRRADGRTEKGLEL